MASERWASRIALAVVSRCPADAVPAFWSAATGRYPAPAAPLPRRVRQATRRDDLNRARQDALKHRLHYRYRRWCAKQRWIEMGERFRQRSLLNRGHACASGASHKGSPSADPAGEMLARRPVHPRRKSATGRRRSPGYRCRIAPGAAFGVAFTVGAQVVPFNGAGECIALRFDVAGGACMDAVRQFTDKLYNLSHHFISQIIRYVNRMEYLDAARPFDKFAKNWINVISSVK